MLFNSTDFRNLVPLKKHLLSSDFLELKFFESPHFANTFSVSCNASQTMDKRTNQILLDNFFRALEDLREAKILINKKDFTGQIGEWFVEMIYDGKRSSNSIEKGWDVKIDNEFVQVKTHAKAESNKARRTAIKIDYQNVQIDFLIIVIFTQNYKLKEFYKIPWNEVKKLVKICGINTPKTELTWNSVAKYRIEINKLPNQKIVQLFL